MSRFFIAILFVSLLFSCKPGIPKDIIQPSEMEKILYDIHVIDGYASTFDTATPDSLKKTLSPLYKGVYKKFGTDSVGYSKSLNYYYQHPKEMMEIYQHISDKLKKARDKAAKVSNTLPPPADNRPDTAAKKIEEAILPAQ
jgi:hypothetical protein